MIKKYSFLQIKEGRKSLFLTALLSIILFWIGLGIGDNMSDYRFWVNNTWLTVKLEWGFIIIYILIQKKVSSLYNLWRQHKFIMLITILWLCTILLSYVTSPYYSLQNPLAYMRLAETVTHIFFFFVLWDIFTHNLINYRIIFMTIVFSTFFILGYFVYIHYVFPGLEAEEHVFSIRSNKLFFNTHLHRIGYQVEATIAFATAFLFFKKERYMALVLIGILLLFLIWLGGRAAMLGSLISLLICLIYFQKNIIQIKTSTYIKFGLISIFFFIISIYFKVINLNYFIHSLHKTFQATSLDHLLTGRIEVWSLVIEKLNGHWLLGTGPQSYFFYLNRHVDVIHAHNFILQLLGEWGLLGTTLFLILLYRALKHGFIMHKSQSTTIKSYQFAAGLVILSLTITGLFGGTYFFPQTTIYLIVAFSLWSSSGIRQ